MIVYVLIILCWFPELGPWFTYSMINCDNYELDETINIHTGSETIFQELVNMGLISYNWLDASFYTDFVHNGPFDKACAD